MLNTQYFEYVDNQGQQVADEEDSHDTEQHGGQPLLPRLTPAIMSYFVGNIVKIFIGNYCQLLSPLIPCYACSDLWGPFDFLVNQKVKYCQEWEGDDVHEDKVHPGHVNLQRIHL